MRELRHFEIRATDPSSPALKLLGYAARYSKPALIEARGTQFLEVIAPGAFEGILRTKNLDTVLTFNHSANSVLARSSAGTLRLKSDVRGLSFEADLPNTQEARDVHANVLAGNLSECSFSFSADKDEWEDSTFEGRSIQKRTLLSFSSLSDISVVVHPSYKGVTSVEARSLKFSATDGETEDQKTCRSLAAAALKLASMDFTNETAAERAEWMTNAIRRAAEAKATF